MSLAVSIWQCQLYNPCWNYIHWVHLCLQLCLLDSVNSTARAGTTSTVYIYVSNCVYLTVSTLQPVLELHPLGTFMSPTVSTWQCQLYNSCWNYIHCVHLCFQLCLFDSVNSTTRAGTTSTGYIYVYNCVYLTVSTLQPVLELHPLCTFMSPTVSIWQCQLYNPCWNYIHCVHLCLQLCLFDSVNSTTHARTTSTVYIYVSNCVYLTVSTLQPVLELHPLCTFMSLTVSIWQCQLYSPCWNSSCVNTVPGYQCHGCPPGYGGSFEDAIAINTTRRIYVFCGQTYSTIQLQSCGDVDECAVNNGGCDTHSTCYNTVVSEFDLLFKKEKNFTHFLCFILLFSWDSKSGKYITIEFDKDVIFGKEASNHYN